MPRTKRTPKDGTVPTKDEVRRFLKETNGPISRREIARAFGIRGSARADLRALLKEMADEGLIDRGHRRRYAEPGDLPSVAVLEIYEADEDGALYGRPIAKTDADAPPPRIVVAPERGNRPALGIGDRVLARLNRTSAGYDARIIRRLAAAPPQIVGVFRHGDGGGRIVATSKRDRDEYTVKPDNSAGAGDGEIVTAEVLPGRRLGLREAKVTERLGASSDAGAASTIAIHTHDIPDRFPDAAVTEATTAGPATPDGRVDLRAVPLVTIDGPDARDFDDAIWAAPDDDPKNKDGWHLTVAIADVAHYVRTGSALDREARKRGNSVYFPDRVVPMLPHELSSDLCSLVPGQDRAVLAVHMTIDKDGRKLSHRFERGLMRSAARLTYEHLQRAQDGAPADLPDGLMQVVVEPLYGAWAALLRGRNAREPLDLDLPEMQVILQDGKVTSILPRPRYDSHRIVEDFMIAANVCAAETLEAARQPCMYRVHDEPDREKMRGLKEFLGSLGLNLTLGEQVRPYLFNRVLAKAKDGRHWEAVNQAILRSQAQAVYSADNIGHFGLSLRRYAHFTSPIRRYSDLLVHRALIRGLKLGKDGLTDDEAGDFDGIAEHISNTERRAMAAERDANDRYLAAYMEARIDAEFVGRIGGVSRAGLFVTLSETGADGLVPIRSLPQDYYIVDADRHALIGEHTGRTFQMGETVNVRLREAIPLTGGLILELLSDDSGVTASRRPKGARRPPYGRKTKAKRAKIGRSRRR